MNTPVIQTQQTQQTQGTLRLTIAEVRTLTPLITAFRLRHPEGKTLPAYAAGAHVKVEVEIAGQKQWRCYSLINADPAKNATERPAEYLIAVRREDAGRGGSLHLHRHIAAGDMLTVSAPINAFQLDAKDDDVLLIAGGIGITPILSMAAALSAANKRFSVHYSGRSLDQLALIAELGSVAGAALTLYGDDDEKRKFDLRRLLAAFESRPPIYVCGPKGMIDAVLALATELGWPGASIHYELFVEASAQAGDRPFEVELTQSGVTISVTADKTILDAMLDAGLDPMFDCKRGDCGVCSVPVLEGEIDHRDNFLSEVERADGKVMQICISRAKCARLVLDA